MGRTRKRIRKGDLLIMKKNTIVINLFGGQGTGKSTTNGRCICLS